MYGTRYAVFFAKANLAVGLFLLSAIRRVVSIIFNTSVSIYLLIIFEKLSIYSFAGNFFK
jgi:hypothetical protein